jgi:hypothetical protein
MKLIVVNDSDGHTWAVASTPYNREKLLSHAVAAGVCGFDDVETDEIPAGRTFGGVCEEIDTDDLREWPSVNPFYAAPSPPASAPAGLQITLAELLVLVDALEASLHYKDLLEAYKFDAATRDRVLAALTQRMHATAVPVQNESPARKAFDGLYPVGDE